MYIENDSKWKDWLKSKNYKGAQCRLEDKKWHEGIFKQYIAATGEKGINEPWKIRLIMYGVK